uniref:restriction endonuclease subunit S n=1 Tax=Prevotella sp. TaxID=59823 RepID=UPI00402701FD
MGRVYKSLGELGRIITGKTPKTDIADYWGGHVPFITPTDINGYDSFFQGETERYISAEGVKKQKATLLPPKSVCFSCIASIGKSCLTRVCSITNQQINSIIPNKENDYRYLLYLLRYNLPYIQMVGGGSGSGTPIINKNKFAKFKFLVEGNLEAQHRIASILSTYDSLIENNTKRIRLLEKMAENLYKEWFVRFRFPGHENVEMENGLPKGWKRGSLSDVCEFKRGKNITSSEMQEGNVPVISAGLEPSGYHSCSNVRGVNVTMSSSGANAGYIAIHYSDIWAADCSYIEESTTGNIYYVYELLNNIRTVINNFQRGAAQPHVYPKDVNRIKLILPSKELMLKANGRLEIMHKEIYNLQKQNSLLARQRDLLLPRLMSGKLEVKEELLE